MRSGRRATPDILTLRSETLSRVSELGFLIDLNVYGLDDAISLADDVYGAERSTGSGGRA